MVFIVPFLKKINVMNTSKISGVSKGLLLIVGCLFIASLFYPMWQIELEAPQYPEGLVLKLHANKIGGDVEIINGLNHYIGMATLHTENFIEFTVLPYIFAAFALISIVSLLVARRKMVLYFLIIYVLFIVLAAIDFYRWNYEYGHNLDPNAAIKVPGMAYQPPLIGYKQLLNFGAYSVPDIGGWMLTLAGILLFAVVVMEFKLFKRFQKNTKATLLILLTFGFFLSCSTKDIEPIKLNVDQCSFCKMTIADGKFGAEIITKKGRVYKFDDLHCMKGYLSENKTDVKSYFVHDYTKENILISAEKAFYLKDGAISSPMRGNIAAFVDESEASAFQSKLNAQPISFEEISAN